MSDTKTTELHQAAKGIAWMILTGLCFAGVTGIVRYLGWDMPAIEAAFIRYLIGFLLVLPFFLTAVSTGSFKRNVGMYAIRGLVHGKQGLDPTFF